MWIIYIYICICICLDFVKAFIMVPHLASEQHHSQGISRQGLLWIKN